MFKTDTNTDRQVTTASSTTGRLAQWQAQLLDISAANRLLNFKCGPAMVRVSAGVPLDQLAAHFAQAARAGEGGALKLVPGKAGQEGFPWRATELALHAAEDAPTLTQHLQNLARRARECDQGLGLHPLYLGLGLLDWTDEYGPYAVEPCRVMQAPVWLVPVSLHRSGQSDTGWQLQRGGAEALFNPALRELMRQRFNSDLVHFELDATLTQILQSLRLAIAGRVGWELKEQGVLGIFSFGNAVLWQDLAAREARLRDNPLVAHLIDHPGQTIPRIDFPSIQHWQREAESIVAPVPTDASQRAVLAAVNAGHSLVVHGPPGTGKSDTVANLVAMAIAKGKSVLVVSAKSAALDVVQRRLGDVGLAPSCLKLHSSDARAADVLAQLQVVLDAVDGSTNNGLGTDLNQASERMLQQGRQLNDVMQGLQTASSAGFTLHEALASTLQTADSVTTVAMPWADPDVHTPAEVRALRDTVRQVAALACDLPDQGLRMDQHPLQALGVGVNLKDTFAHGLRAQARVVDAALQRLACATAIWLQRLGAPAPIPTALSLAQVGLLSQLAELVGQACCLPPDVRPHALDRQALANLEAARRHQLRQRQLLATLPAVFCDSVLDAPSRRLAEQWLEAEQLWEPWRWWARRKVMRDLHQYVQHGQVLTVQDVDHLLERLPTVQHDATATAQQLARLPWFMQPQAAPDPSEPRLENAPECAALDDHQLAWMERVQHTVETTGAALADCGVPHDWSHHFTTWLVTHHAPVQVTAAEPDAQADVNVLGDGLAAWDALQRSLPRLMLSAKTNARDATALYFGGATTLAQAQACCAAWAASASLWPAWRRWQALRRQAIGQGLGGLIDAIDRGQLAMAEIERVFEQSYRLWWGRALLSRVSKEPVSAALQALAGFDGLEQERGIATFAGQLLQAQAAARKSAQDAVTQQAHSALHPQHADAELGALRRELARQRGHRPLRRILRDMPSLMLRLKPCWLMSPLSAAQYLGADHPGFDLVVFDEASQLPVCEAVGAMSRAGQVVILGDPQQLPPSNFFKPSHINAEQDNDATALFPVADLDSVLDEALAIGMPTLSLNTHYRSRHESLIAFSNAHFYVGKLLTTPAPAAYDRALRLQFVGGGYARGASRTNQAEAEAVVQAIEAHCLQDMQPPPSLGVVTFNQAQQHMIETLLQQRRRDSPTLDAVVQDMARGGEALFVRNLESVQGDERDHILFSITYGPDTRKGHISLNFGPLGRAGGARRLNVAVTRARQAVTVFTSLRAADLPTDCGNAGVKALQAYLTWAETATRSAPDPVTAACDLSVRHEQADSGTPCLFERFVKHALQERGWQVHGAVGHSRQRVDLAVVDPRQPDRYLMALLCDGAHSLAIVDAADRQVLRAQRLHAMGWQVRRLWLLDWVKDGQTQLEILDAQLRAAAAVALDAGFGSA